MNKIEITRKRPLKNGSSLGIILPSAFVLQNKIRPDTLLSLSAGGERFQSLVIEVADQ